MKKIVTGEILQEKMKESIHLLCDTVKTTLGPKGNNVIIDHSLFTPFITNDGATIAKNIESEDEVVNTILEIAKEASLKTNDTVGDGTTTTLVLLESIFDESLKCIQNGTNPILLKQEFHTSLQKIIKAIEELKMKPNTTTLENIAKIAANDEEIGSLVSEVFLKVKTKNAITIKEIEETTLNVSFLKGYSLDIHLASDYFLKNQKNLNYKNAVVLLINDFVDNLENISFVLNDCINNNKNLIVIASDFDENVVQEMISLNLQDVLDCCLIKIAEYGMRQRIVAKDLEVITNAKIVENYNQITLENLGFVKGIMINKDIARIDFETTPKIKEYLTRIEQEEKEIQDDFDECFYQKRIAMLESGIAEIVVGAPTKTECHEKKMRIDDAICALESAQDGILPGGGVTLLKIANEMKIQNTADAILKKALEKPFMQILLNSGLEVESIYKEIKKVHYEKVYNVHKNQFEDCNNTIVVDSSKVIIKTLENACSIATMLLTTTSLIINEYDNNANKTNEYTEL